MDEETRRSLGRFVARLDTMREGGPPTAAARQSKPRLVVVTAENAASLAPASKLRGRPRMVREVSNVVVLRPRPVADKPVSDFVAKAMANFAAMKQQERAARQPKPAAPASPHRSEFDDWLRARCAAFLALPIGGGPAPVQSANQKAKRARRKSGAPRAP